jgi:hypothetical protein
MTKTVTSWRKMLFDVIANNGDTPDGIVYEEDGPDMDKEWTNDSDYHHQDFVIHYFMAWTANFVYSNDDYDGAPYVTSMPRNPPRIQ